MEILCVVHRIASVHPSRQQR